MIRSCVFESEYISKNNTFEDIFMVDMAKQQAKDNRMMARKLLYIIFPDSKNTFDVPPLLGTDLFYLYFRSIILFKFIDDINVS
jgi:hypothetical protein